MTRWVVVGAGTAGCVVAGRLAEAGHEVTLVEAGPAAPGRAVRAASFFEAMAETGRLYPGPIARGRGLGGSGAVNGMVATTGDIAQYESWGWLDAADAFARVRVPVASVAAAELGPLDRALLAAAPDAEVATLTRRDGRRVTAADVYLDAVAVDIVGDAAVARLQVEHGRAGGVVLEDGRRIAAERVALAAGALGSPAVLVASGVDPPGMARRPRNHPGLPVTLQLRRGVDTGSLVTASLLRRGDLQVLPLNHLGAGEPGNGMLLVALMNPSGDWEDDRVRLGDGVALVEELLAHDAFAELVAGVQVGEPPAGVHHPTSTCPMGTAVDDDGLVAGTENVHVVDASVFPDLPTTNTYLPTLMLAERLAARLVER